MHMCPWLLSSQSARLWCIGWVGALRSDKGKGLRRMGESVQADSVEGQEPCPTTESQDPKEPRRATG